MMAKPRIVTFAVTDHLDLRSLIPFILMSDKLAFPYPHGAYGYKYWNDQGWDPKLLDYCLTKFESSMIAILVDWDENIRGLYRNKVLAARSGGGDVRHIESRKDGWSRRVLSDVLHSQYGDEYWISPAFTTFTGFLTGTNSSALLPVSESLSRRERLAWLVTQRMAIPDNIDERAAFDRSVELALDSGFQRSRRALYNWQENVLAREQSSKDDAQDLADLIADFNRYVERSKGKKRKQWTFWLLKRLAKLPELIVNPISSAEAAVEAAEMICDDSTDGMEGPLAAFAHVRKQVILRSRTYPPTPTRKRFGSTVQRFSAAFLAEAAERTKGDTADGAAQVVDDALLELCRQETELFRQEEAQREVIRLKRLVILEEAIRQHTLRRDAAAVAKRIEERVAVEHYTSLPTWHLEFRVYYDRYCEEGEGKRATFSLEVAIACARRMVATARDEGERGLAFTLLGDALQLLGERGFTEPLLEAIKDYRAALQERMRERVPLDWARTQNNLGNALKTFSSRESGTARLEDAVKAYRAALEERTQDRAPLDWARTQNNLGNALQELAARKGNTANLVEAIAAWEACLTVSISHLPPEWIDDARSRIRDAKVEIARRSAAS